MGTTKKIVIEYTMKEALARGLIGCANCVKATKGRETHPPNNHFDADEGGSCARCGCKKYEMMARGGKQIIKKRKKPSTDPAVIYAAENADMVGIIRRLVEAMGEPYLSIPFLDDCVSTLINERNRARQALLQVKVDYLNKKAKMPMKTHAMIEHALRKE